MLRRRMMLLAPLIEEPAVAERHILAWLHSQAHSYAIDPLRRAFQFGEVSDGRLVDHAMSFAIAPLRAPLFVAEGFDESQRAKNCGKGLAVGDDRLCLYAMLVLIFAGPHVRQPFVRQEASPVVVADAQNLGAGAHGAIRCVIEDIAFKGA